MQVPILMTSKHYSWCAKDLLGKKIMCRTIYLSGDNPPLDFENKTIESMNEREGRGSYGGYKRYLLSVMDI